MYSSFFKLYIPIIFIMTLISFFIIIILSNNTDFAFSDNSTSEFYWPLPGNRNITSLFGNRTSPTTGASSFHSGIDIGATEGTPIYSCITGQVIFIGFQGANRLYNNRQKQQY